MKVARFALIVSLLLFLCTAAFSSAEASSYQSIRLMAHVPKIFTFDIRVNGPRIMLRPNKNFKFNGKIESDGVELTEEILELSASKHYKIVSITVN